MSGSYINYLTSQADHDKLVTSRGDKLVIINASAAWCGPCKAVAPKYEQLAKEYRGVTFCKFDVDNVKELASQYSVRAMPTFLFVKNGKVVDQVKGANIAAIETALKHHSGANATGSAFPGQGQTLSGNAPPRPTGEEGKTAGLVLKTLLALWILYYWYSYSIKATPESEM